MALLPQDKATQRKLLYVLLPLLALFGYWYFMHQGAVTEITQLEGQLTNLEQQNATARALAARAGPELEQRMALYEEYMVRLERLIPSQQEVARLLDDISQRAVEVGVNLSLVTPQAESPGRYYTRQTYEMAVTGTFHDIGRFLAEVGSLPRIVTPIDLELEAIPAQRGQTRQRREGEPMPLTANFRIETYVLQQQPADTAQAGANADR